MKSPKTEELGLLRFQTETAISSRISLRLCETAPSAMKTDGSGKRRWDSLLLQQYNHREQRILEEKIFSCDTPLVSTIGRLL